MGKKGKRPAVQQEDLFDVTTEATTKPPKRSRIDQNESSSDDADGKKPANSSSSVEAPVEVEIDEQELNTCTAVELYEFAAEELQNSGGDSDRAAVAQKLLEAALEKFQAENEKGQQSVSFLHQYASCLVTVGSQMIVLELIQKGIELLESALKLNTDAASTPSNADILGAYALALADKARVTYMLDDDDVDDDDGDDKTADEDSATDKKVKDALAESQKQHQACLALLTKPEDKAEKMMGLSCALLEFSQDLDDDAEAQKDPLATATALAEAATALTPNSAPCTTQYGACLISKATAAKLIEDHDVEEQLLKQAVVQLNKSLVTEDTTELVEALQMMGNAQIRIAHMEEDDDAAEALIMQAVAHYTKANKLDPGNRKLAKMVEMMCETSS
eukprot:m.146768 g.146768  ORF g.146768 m.146768 type:complete len:391 (-) comp30498_c0_seq1:199-1371(-)